MHEASLIRVWLFVFSLISSIGALICLKVWFRLRSLENLENAKIQDLYDQIDSLKNRIDSMFN